MKKKAFSEIIGEITGGIKPLCTIEEIASVTRVHPQTVYSWKNDNTEPGYSKIMDLSCHLISKYGYHTLASQFMLVCEGEANGKVEDDLMHIYEAGTDLVRSFRERDYTAYLSALAQMEAEIKDLKKEGEGIA